MKITLSLAAFLAANSVLMAGGTIAPVFEEIETAQSIEKFAFIKEVKGYIRAGYQNTDITDDRDYTDISLGGKLHIDTNSWNGMSLGASFYTTNVVDGYNEGQGVPFFDADNHSYSILGEAYLQGEWGNTLVKIGRQEMDTPFLDTDDIGMIPNTFEAALFVNKDIANTTITLAHVEKMAGVDAEANPAEFEDIRFNDYVQIVGLEYEMMENLMVSGWYYNLKNPQTNSLIYADMIYSGNSDTISYEIGVQYAHRNLSDSNINHANIYGAMIDVGFENMSLNLGMAYNVSQDNYATNGFGGGPFYTSAEHLTLREANADGEALMLSASWDAGIVGIEGLTLGTGHLTLEDQYGNEATELDLTASYALNDMSGLDVIFSDIDDEINGDKLTNLRVFVNYIF